MKLRFALPLAAGLAAIALAITLPTGALADSDGHGKHRRGQWSESRDGDSGKRRRDRDDDRRSSESRSYDRRAGGWTRGDAGEGRRAWRRDDSGSRGWREGRDSGALRTRSREWRQDNFRERRGAVRDLRYRNGGDGTRYDTRWRDGGEGSYQPRYKSRTYYRDGGYSPSYRTRSYYVGGFHRPRFIHRSGFSLGIVLSTVPAYDYRYFDPYCDISFGSLDDYYDHCDDYGHPDVIMVMDVYSGYPVASCVYQGGYWVVDDCY